MDALFISLLALSSVLCFFVTYYYYYLQSKKTSPIEPTEWPVFGHLFALLAHINSFHDSTTQLMAAVGHNFELRMGITGLRYFVTCDPANVRHIYTSNFANYPKGHEFVDIFDDLLGGGLFNADGESWQHQRVKAQMLITSPRFRAFVARCSRDKVEKSLLPFLADAADDATPPPCDLQDVFLRLAFDMVCTLVFGIDNGCLATGLPVVPFMRAVDIALETACFRHFIPIPCWKLMRRVNLGPERKMAVARQTIDSFIAQTIARRRTDKRAPEEFADMLSSLLSDDSTDKFIRDTAVNMVIAGRDAVAVTLSWFFYLVSKNPSVERKLLDELSGAIASRDEGARAADGAMVTFDATELSSLVYLHAALSECLRLYPPIPFELKAAAAADVLPSGKELKAGDRVALLTYCMGRMEGVWGKDCMEFRPERWINQEGKLRHEPSYKFFSFNAGPRTCIGKEMAFLQLKTVAAAVLWNFTVEVVPGHVVEPKLSIVLLMKNGLLVRVHRRHLMGHK